MAHIANVKLGKYQVHRIYLGDRIIWEIMPVRSKDSIPSYEITLGQIPITSSLGWSEVKYQSNTARPLNLKEVTDEVYGTTSLKIYNTNLSVDLDASTAQGDINIENTVSALAAFYKALFGTSIINLKTTTTSCTDLASLITITSYNDEKINTNGSIVHAFRDIIATKQQSLINQKGVMIYAVKDKVGGKSLVKNYTILTNKIPHAQDSLNLTGQSFFDNNTIGKIGKKKSLCSNNDSFSPMVMGCAKESHCLFISSEYNKIQDFVMGLANFSIKIPLLSQIFNSTSVCGIGGNRYHFYMGANNIDLKVIADNIMKSNKNLYMYVTFKNTCKSNVLTHAPEAICTALDPLSGELNSFNIVHKWYPLLGYPKVYNEITLSKENYRVPLTEIDKSLIMKNRKSIFIRQAFEIIDQNNGILEVN